MFSYLKPGDKVTRLISTAQIPMIMTVEKIENDIITMVGGWTFDVKTGIEIDEDLGFGPKEGLTGSVLTTTTQ